jgi:hypothetical protein
MFYFQVEPHRVPKPVLCSEANISFLKHRLFPTKTHAPSPCRFSRQKLEPDKIQVALVAAAERGSNP